MLHIVKKRHRYAFDSYCIHVYVYWMFSFVTSLPLNYHYFVPLNISVRSYQSWICELKYSTQLFNEYVSQCPQIICHKKGKLVFHLGVGSFILYISTFCSYIYQLFLIIKKYYFRMTIDTTEIQFYSNVVEWSSLKLATACPIIKYYGTFW